MSGPRVAAPQPDEDLQATRDFLNDLDWSPFDPSKPHGLFAGAGESLKGFGATPAATGRSLMMAGAALPIAIDKAAEIGDRLGGGGKPREAWEPAPKPLGATDWYFRNVVDELGSTAVDHYRPDVAAMGSGARALHQVTTVLGSVPEMVAMPEVFLGNAGLDPATELTRQGVDPATAGTVGAINLVVNAAGMKLPAAFGSTLTTRVATGAGSNVAMGAAQDAATRGVLSWRGYDEQAAGYDAADPYARGLDVLMGLAFGANAHREARITPAQRDAVLVATNADHFQRGTLPGEPAAPGADVRHQRALEDAIARVLAGERVDVSSAIDPSDFKLPPAFQPAQPAASPTRSPVEPTDAAYERMVVALESGGRADAKAPTSSATGLFQFTGRIKDGKAVGTWPELVARVKPAWAEGLTPQQVLDARLDPAKSREMERHLRAENAAALRSADLPVTAENLYAAHHFGEAGGVKFARADDATPMREILTPGQLKANPYLRDLTKGEARANWQRRAGDAGSLTETRIAATDRRPFEAADVPAARATAADAADAVRVEPARPSLDVLRSGETSLSDPPRDATVDEYAAWMQGRQRQFIAQQRQQFEASPGTRGADPAAGQPPRQDARLANLNRAEAELERLTPDNPTVQRSYAAWKAEAAARPATDVPAAQAALDGAGARAGAGEAASVRAPADGSATPAAHAGRDAAPLRDTTADLQPRQPDGRTSAPGRIAGDMPHSDAPRVTATAEGSAPPSSAADAATSPSSRGRPNSALSTREAVAAARALVESMPELGDMRVATEAVDAEGRPVTRTAAELLADAQREAARARTEARAIETAAECFLRIGE